MKLAIEESVLRMALDALEFYNRRCEEQGFYSPNRQPLPKNAITALRAALKEAEKVAKWMMERGYATGHGDTIEDLLVELEWQVKEKVDMLADFVKECNSGRTDSVSYQQQPVKC